MHSAPAGVRGWLSVTDERKFGHNRGSPPAMFTELTAILAVGVSQTLLNGDPRRLPACGPARLAAGVGGAGEIAGRPRQVAGRPRPVPGGGPGTRSQGRRTDRGTARCGRRRPTRRHGSDGCSIAGGPARPAGTAAPSRRPGPASRCPRHDLCAGLFSSPARPPSGGTALGAAPGRRRGRRGSAPGARRRGRATGRSASSARLPPTCSTHRPAPGRSPCR